jgi:para-nitrobenzyl esterase
MNHSKTTVCLIGWMIAWAGCSNSMQSSGQAASAAGSGGSAGSSTSAGSSAPGDATLVSLASGKVQGDMIEDGVLRFLKIPYAKPPVAELRWKPPVKADAWSGTRHETEFATGCPQNKSGGSDASTSEDCLYLNVWAPNPKPSKAPVMVWIHGGGDFAGSAGDKVPTSQQLWFDGKAFAQKHGIVVVTFNYRLGPFGFFAHPELTAEGSNPGNQGLLDQTMVLSWAHDNIAAFGGDPANVTIFGESAGSANVCYHMVSPKSRGLFQHAISESGGCTVGLIEQKTAEHAQTVQKFAKALGCEAAQGQLACLRNKPVGDLLANAMQPDPMMGGNAGIPFYVVVDGDKGFLPKPAKALFDAGDVAHVPYMLGSNSDEGTLFLLSAKPPSDDAGYAAELKTRFGDSADKVLAMYPVSKFGGDYKAALARVIGDSGLVCGTHDSARRAAKAGMSVFMYNFNVPWSLLLSLGATHSSEISHVFGLPLNPTPDSQQIADEMNAYWARFATTGNPNGPNAKTQWPSFAPDASDSDQRLQLDAAFQVIKDFRKDECALWRSIYDASAAAP